MLRFKTSATALMLICLSNTLAFQCQSSVMVVMLVHATFELITGHSIDTSN